MDTLLNKDQPTEVRLRAFRAIDDQEACLLFLRGHERVLTDIGVKKVTSSNNAWMYNPSAFVLIVESLDGSKVYGGARVHVAGGSEPLPIEQATFGMDPSIRDIVYDYAQKGTAEICGLWSSREIAGLGLGNVLFRSATAICTQIGLTSLFALCAPYTLYMVKNVGFNVLERVGNKGTFYYPKLDLVATAVLMEEIVLLEHATDADREVILHLREHPSTVIVEQPKKKSIAIHYELQIPNLEAWDLNVPIANAGEQFRATPGGDISFL